MDVIAVVFALLLEQWRPATHWPLQRVDSLLRGAIDGQARGETEMRDYELLKPATPEVPGQVRQTRSYKLTPGIAHVYNEGDLHSPKRAGATSLIRIEGTNMDKVKRLQYVAV